MCAVYSRALSVSCSACLHLLKKSSEFRLNQTDTFFGKPVSDPYRLPEDTVNKKVKAWMHAESDKTNPYFASLPGSKQMHDREKIDFGPGHGVQ